MADTTLLFFIGLAGVVVLSRLVAMVAPRAGFWLFAPPYITWILLATSLVVLAAIVAFPTLGYWSYWRHDGWMLLRSVALGCWIAFLAGCVAGFVLAAALSAIDRWGPHVNTTNIIILAAGPGLTIILLYLLVTPGVMQSLGLTGIKAGEVEITLAPRQTPTTDVPSLTPSQPILGTISGEYTRGSIIFGQCFKN